MRAKHLLTVGLLSCLLPTTATAGVVVLKSGKVMVGDVAEETKEFIVLKYRKPQRGEFKVERHQVRWYDAEVDTLTEAYFDKFADAKLDKAWEPVREKWKLNKKTPKEEIPPPAFDKELLGTRKIEFASKDGLQLSADLYGASDKTRPFIILCHQARSSRGEYSNIAPKLVKAGFACLALDLRSGRAMNKIVNETASRAAKAGKICDYPSARQDIEAAITYVREQGFTGKLTLWGSSYSASLALMVGAASKDALAAVVAFSPGDYLKPKGTVAEEAKGLELPVLLVGPEKERGQIEALAKVIPSEGKTIFLEEELVHGSKTLYLPKKTDGVWEAVMGFLEKHSK